MSYDAFVSYSHTSDSPLALALQSGLHRFAKPLFKMRSLRVFRDASSLSANSGLWESIESALDQSEYFILLACPEAAQSQWVSDEIRYWCEHKSPDRLILVRTGGDICWEQTQGDFNWKTSSALPISLRGCFTSEPRWVDLAWAHGAADLSLGHPGFRDVVADIAATVHGRPKDELVGEDVYQQRRTRRLAWSAIIVLTLLFAASSVAAFIAIEQRREAIRQRDQALMTQSLFLSDLSRQQVENDRYDQGVLLALEALPKEIQRPDRPYVPEAEAALYNALHRYRPVARFGFGESLVLAGALSPDSTKAVAALSDGTARVLSVERGKELVTLAGHNADVNHIEFAPDSLSIVTASDDGSARLFDARSGKKIGQLDLQGAVDLARFSPDGKKILAVADGQVSVWDAASRKRIAVCERQTTVQAAEFSQDGRWIVTAAYDKTARLWNASTCKQIQVFKGHDEVLDDAAVSPDGRLVVTAAEDNTARIWNVETGKQIHLLEGHLNQGNPLIPNGLSSVAFHSSGLLVATGGFDGTARLWSVDTGQQIHELRHDSVVWDVVFHPEEPLLITGAGDGRVVLWNLLSGVRKANLRPQTMAEASGIPHLRLDPKGKRLLVTEDHAVAVWSIPTEETPDLVIFEEDESELYFTNPEDVIFSPDGKRLLELSDAEYARLRVAATGDLVGVLNHRSSLLHAAFNADGTRIVTASYDGTARIWDGKTGELKTVLNGHGGEGVNAAAFSRDGRMVVTGGRDGRACIWNAVTGRLLRVLKGHEDDVAHAEFSPDGRLVVTASDDQTARIWSVESGKSVHILKVPDERIHFVSAEHASFDPEGRRLLTYKLNRGAQLWDVESGAKLHELRSQESHESVASFSPDGSRVVTADSEGAVEIWDARTGERLLSLSGHSEEVRGAEFSPNGLRVATFSWEERTVRLWDALTGQQLAVFSFPEPVNSATFSPDSARLAVATEDGLFRFWTLLPRRQELIELGRKMVNRRVLTRKERQEFFLAR